MSPTLTALLLFFGTLLTLGLLYGALVPSQGSVIPEKRLAKLKLSLSSHLSIETRMQARSILSSREDRLDSFFKQFIPRKEQLQARLDRTGLTISLGHYALASLVIGLGTAGGLSLGLGVPVLIALLIGIALAAGVPHLALNFCISRRMTKFLTLFPDAIDLMVRGLKSGLPITESLNIVSREVPAPVGNEFRIAADRIRIGMPMEQALLETAGRIRTPEFQFFVITLAIQKETGGNLAETLANLGEVLRKRQQMKLKINAMSSESKASAYIVGSLPFIVFGLIYSVNPDYLAAFFTDPRLMMTGGGGLLWMGIGVGIMAKMVSFEI